MRRYLFVVVVFMLGECHIGASQSLPLSEQYKEIFSELSKKKYSIRDSCLVYTNKLRDLSDNNDSDRAIALAFDGFNLIYLDESVEAFSMLNESLEIGLSIKDRRVMSLAKSHLAYYFIKNGMKSYATKYAEESVKHAEESNDSLALSIAYHYLGTCYSSFGYSGDFVVLKNMFDTAELYLKRAIDFAPYETQRLISMSNLAQANYYFHKHSKSNDFKLEKAIHEEVLESALKENFLWAIIESRISLGLICHQEQNYFEAIEHFEEGIELATKTKDDWSLEQLYGHLISSRIRKSEINELSEIPKYVNQIKTIVTKRLKEKLNKELAEIEKDNEIIRQRDAISVNELEIQSRTRDFNYLLIFLVCVVFSTTYFYFLNRKNRRLSSKNQLLLKEQNHRVKNNLQMISSLLSLQSQKLLSSDAKEALTDSQARVNSVALLHRMLYEGEQVGFVDVATYLRSLTEEVKYASHRELEVQLEVSLNLLLKVERATSLGLIINELMTNSIKHARTESLLLITISINESEDQIILDYRDNGEEMDIRAWESSDSFGNQLIKIQTEQMNGQVKISSKNGFNYHLTLKIG